MIKKLKIKKLAKKSLKKKWGKKKGQIGDSCPFCDKYSCLDCTLPKIICFGISLHPFDNNVSLMGAYRTKLRRKNSDSVGYFSELPEEDLNLMRDAMKNLAKTGYIGAELYTKITTYIRGTYKDE